MPTSRSSRWLALAALAIAMLTIGLDTTVLTVALPTLSVDLGASNAQLQWFASAYTLVLAAVLLPAGSLGDRFGRKRLLLGALVLFGAASVLCAYAGSAGTLIAARAAPRPRCRDHDAALHGRAAGAVPGQPRARAGADHLGHVHRHRPAARTDPRRLAAGALLVGFDLPDQRAAGAVRRARGRAVRPGVPRQRLPPGRPAGDPALLRRAARAHLRLHPDRAGRLVRPRRLGAGRRGCRAAGTVRRAPAPGGVPADRPGPVPQPRLHPRVRAGHSDQLRDVRPALPGAAVPPGGRRCRAR